MKALNYSSIFLSQAALVIDTLAQLYQQFFTFLLS